MAERTTIPRRLIDFLDAHNVRYKIIHHPVAYTAQELASVENIKGKNHAKVVILKTERAPVMAVVRSDYHIDLNLFHQATGLRAAKAAEGDFKCLFPDCAVGTMPPFGHLYGIQTYVDQCLAEEEFIVFEAGTHSDAIRMDYGDYARLERPSIFTFGIKCG